MSEHVIISIHISPGSVYAYRSVKTTYPYEYKHHITIHIIVHIAVHIYIYTYIYIHIYIHIYIYNDICRKTLETH